MRIIRVDGDGNCLFHACAYHLDTTAEKLRKHVTMVMEEYQDLPIEETPLKEWIKMSSETSPSNYIKRMSKAGVWGSALELSLIAIMYHRTIQVYTYDWEIISRDTSSTNNNTATTNMPSTNNTTTNDSNRWTYSRRYRRKLRGFKQIAEFFADFGHPLKLLWTGNHYNVLVDK